MRINGLIGLRPLTLYALLQCEKPLYSYLIFLQVAKIFLIRKPKASKRKQIMENRDR